LPLYKVRNFRVNGLSVLSVSCYSSQNEPFIKWNKIRHCYCQNIWSFLSEKTPNVGPLSPFQEGMGEINHQSNKLFNSYGFAMQKKIINVHYDAVRFSDTLHEHFFSLVQLVNCEISFIWIAVLWKQVDAWTVYLSCIMHLHKYFCYFCCFCLTFFNQYYLKKKNALLNTIEMIYLLWGCFWSCSKQ